MSHRVFVDHLCGTRAKIEGAEAHHLLNVLRLEAGDVVELFDGQGNVATARIESRSRRSADVTLLSSISALEPLVRRVTVAVAPARGERLRWMVEKLTEIGAHELILLQTTRSVVHPGDTKLDKLRSVVISACKQCGRNRLMQLQPVTTLDELLHRHSRDATGPRLVVAHPGVTERTAQAPPLTREADLLLIGPEGGFTPEEVDRILSEGAEAVSWPQSILRIETAAVVFTALLLGGTPGVPRSLCESLADC